MKLQRDFTLETERLRLRIVSMYDIPQTFSATRYKGFNDGMPWEPPEKEEDLIPIFKKNIANWDSGDCYTFTIAELESLELLGRIGLKKGPEKDVWSLGFWTHPKHQGNGYMTEAVTAILNLAFTELNIETVEAVHALWNKASEKVLKKNGFKFIRHIPEGFKKNGEWVEENLLAITKEEWKEKK